MTYENFNNQPIQNFNACNELFNITDAFNHNDYTHKLFNIAMQEALNWHLNNCEPYKNYLIKKGLNLNQLPTRPEDIPPIFITIFKEFRLLSIPEHKIKLELMSSGTGGQKSCIVLDQTSLDRILKIVENIFSSLNLVSKNEYVNYICFTYDPKYAKNIGTSFSDEVLTNLTQKKHVFYSLQWNDKKQDFEFDEEGTLSWLEHYSKQSFPIRIIGFPAHLWRICDILENKSKYYTFGDRSFIITGGGWKVHKDKEVSKDLFKEKVSKILGIPKENIRDIFGMVEHGIPYVECECGNLHVPIYARVQVLDPQTLKPLPNGSEGLLHLMTPYLTSYPSISLLSTDKAIISSNCPCKRNGNVITILGRAGIMKHKGCAIKALETIK